MMVACATGEAQAQAASIDADGFACLCVGFRSCSEHSFDIALRYLVKGATLVTFVKPKDNDIAIALIASNASNARSYSDALRTSYLIASHNVEL